VDWIVMTLEQIGVLVAIGAAVGAFFAGLVKILLERRKSNNTAITNPNPIEIQTILAQIDDAAKQREELLNLVNSFREDIVELRWHYTNCEQQLRDRDTRLIVVERRLDACLGIDPC